MILAIRLGLLSIANILFLMLFQWYLFTELGPGVATDAFFASTTIPQLALAIISGSLIHVLVPLLAGESRTQLRHDAWGVWVLVGALFICITIVLGATANWWVPYSVPGFDDQGVQLTVVLTRIQLFSMLFTALNGVQMASYQACKRFIWAESTHLIANGFALASLVWALPHYGVEGAAWISLMRMALQTLLLMPGMGWPVKPDLNSVAIQTAWARIKPLLLGTAYYKTDPFVDRFLLSMAASGSLSLYYFAQQCYNAVTQVISKALVVPMVPELSQCYKNNDMVSFSRLYNKKLIYITALSFVVLLVLVIFGKILLLMIVGYGNVTDKNVIELWWVLIWLSGMFAGSILGQVSSSAFYSLGDTKTPTRIGVYSYTFLIPAKILVFIKFQVQGIAIASSAFMLFNFFMQDLQLRHKYFQSGGTIESK